MRHLVSDFTIDFLLIDARVRLTFERQRKGIRQPVASAGTILFFAARRCWRRHAR